MDPVYYLKSDSRVHAMLLRLVGYNPYVKRHFLCAYFLRSAELTVFSFLWDKEFHDQ